MIHCPVHSYTELHSLILQCLLYLFVFRFLLSYSMTAGSSGRGGM